MKLSLPVIATPSRVELGLRCYRRHVIADLLQRSGYYSPSLEFGSVIHAGAAAWWTHASLDGNVARAKAILAMEQEWTKRFEMNPKVSQKDVSVDLARAMLISYTQLADMRGPFAMEEGDWQFVSIEDRLEVPLSLVDAEAKLSFQTDRVVFNNTNDHLVIIDTKTASRLDKRWIRQWMTSLQMKLYKAGAVKAYDLPPENISVVVEGVLKDVPSNLAYVQCPDWSTELLNEAVRQAQSIAQRDHALIVGGKDFDCFSYGVECPFYKLCLSEPEERVALLNADFFEIPEADSGY